MSMQGSGNDGEAGDDVERAFAEIIQKIPLGLLAEQHCVELMRARAKGEPITRAILVSYIASLGALMRKSQYVDPDKEITMEMEAAKPFLKRLGAAFETRRT